MKIILCGVSLKKQDLGTDISWSLIMKSTKDVHEVTFQVGVNMPLVFLFTLISIGIIQGLKIQQYLDWCRFSHITEAQNGDVISLFSLALNNSLTIKTSMLFLLS